MTRSLDVEDIFAGMAERDQTLAGNGDALKILDLPVQAKEAGHAQGQARHRPGQQQASCDVPQPRRTDPRNPGRGCERTRISRLHIYHRSQKSSRPDWNPAAARRLLLRDARWHNMVGKMRSRTGVGREIGNRSDN